MTLQRRRHDALSVAARDVGQLCLAVGILGYGAALMAFAVIGFAGSLASDIVRGAVR